MSLKRKSKMTERFLEAGLNPKKEYLSLTVVDLVLVVFAILLYWYQRQIVGPISILLLMGGIDYLFLNKPKRILEKKKVSMESEFVHVFSYFSIFVKNGRPVYNALEDCIRYSSLELGECLKRLLEDIDKDKTVAPYLTFSEQFKNLEIKQVMISIYKMSFEGGGESYLRQFETLFENLSSIERENRLEREKSRFGNYNFLPLFASALSMGIIAVAVVILMEDYASVL